MAKNKTVGDVMSETYSISDKGDTWGCQPHSLKIGQLLLSLLIRDPPPFVWYGSCAPCPRARLGKKTVAPPVLLKQKFFTAPGVPIVRSCPFRTWYLFRPTWLCGIIPPVPGPPPSFRYDIGHFPPSQFFYCAERTHRPILPISHMVLA